MPIDISPKSQTSAVILTSTGSTDEVTSALPIGAYTASAQFISGASAQVAYVYKKLGGDVVDIELTPSNVYAAYEEAVLEYSYIINLHNMHIFFNKFCQRPNSVPHFLLVLSLFQPHLRVTRTFCPWCVSLSTFRPSP